MKKKTPTKKAPVKKVEAKKVAPSKPAPAKKPAAPAIDANKVRLMQKEIDDYKMTVGQLEAAIDDLKQKNAKLKKKLASQKAKETPAAPVAAAPTPMPSVKIDTTPTSPFAFAKPMTPVVNNKFAKCSAVGNGSASFLKKAAAVRY